MDVRAVVEADCSDDGMWIDVLKSIEQKNEALGTTLEDLTVEEMIRDDGSVEYIL